MHEISYAGGTIVTSDGVAAVLIEYAAALGNADRAASVDVPAVGLGGESATVQVLVGPASQLMASPVETEGTVAGSDEFVRDITERIEKLRRGWIAPADSSSVDWDL